MLRIDRSENGAVVVFRLSGRIDLAHVPELQTLFDADKARGCVVDLKDVRLVDREAVKFLADVEAGGTELANCPGYIRDWIALERGR